MVAERLRTYVVLRNFIGRLWMSFKLVESMYEINRGGINIEGGLRQKLMF